jgi:hypothetical protein
MIGTMMLHSYDGGDIYNANALAIYELVGSYQKRT